MVSGLLLVDALFIFENIAAYSLLTIHYSLLTIHHSLFMTWYKIADHINELNFSDNNIAVAEMDGKKICIAKFKDEVFAFAFTFEFELDMG